jgi:hypothetical protein
MYILSFMLSLATEDSKLTAVRSVHIKLKGCDVSEVRIRYQQLNWRK